MQEKAAELSRSAPAQNIIKQKKSQIILTLGVFKLCFSAEYRDLLRMSNLFFEAQGNLQNIALTAR